MQIVKCDYCGKEFKTYETRTKKHFCCREHYLEYHKAKTYTCAYCGKTFKDYHNYDKKDEQPKARFCCLEHYHKYIKEVAPLNYPNARNKAPNCVCKNCGKPIYKTEKEIKTNKNTFCSISCSSQYNMKEKMKKYSNDLNATCAYCGKKFHRKKSHLGILNFCDIECKRAYQKQQRVHKVCIVCGKEFEVTKDKSNTAKFCSVKCHDTYQRRFFKHTKCAYCGKEIEVNSSVQTHNKLGKYFCSNKCVGQYYQRENSPNFKGTASLYKILREYFGKYQRGKVFERDKKVCQICGGKANHVHHKYPLHKMIEDFRRMHPEIDITKNCYQVADMLISEIKEFTNLGNLISVCEGCHIEVHKQMRGEEKENDICTTYMEFIQ